IDMFSNRRAVVRGVCREAGEMLFLDKQAFRKFLNNHADLSETIIRAFILRRTGLIYHEHGDLILFGQKESAKLLSLKSFLSRSGHPHQTIDIDENPDTAEKLYQAHGLVKSDLPVVIYTHDQVLKQPSLREVADIIGLSQVSGTREVYDVAVVGVGPGGLAAAVNAAAEGLSVIALDQFSPGGQAGTSSKIENYPAFPTGISGQALSGRMMLQAQKFGTEIITPRYAISLDCDNYPYCIELEDGELIKAKAVVVASGAQWRRLGLEHEEEMENAGVYYGATAVEAALCEGQEVVIVGGGNSAGQAAVFMAQRTKHVHILVRSDNLAASMSDYLIRRIEADPNITLHVNTEVTALKCEDHLCGMTWTHTKTGVSSEKDIRHLFVMIGAIPNSDWLGKCVMRDDRGFVKTGSDLPMDHLVSDTWHVNRMPYIGETSQPGVFAVGDIRSGSVKRVASAVGEGAIAAQFLYKVVNPQR
ncbi:MAG: NAD(P)/FAD-dependent oxidoreductase, partial [Pseudomonadota bacterium]